ncbi:spermidine synthase [Bordetella genomosp. 4]|uniref:spermidine synthase n=1 Tax=Bordetella genomosp. 4 TaxID=463044 RepID=UPI000B9E0BCE|nr:fused MFS/spermidine synthase [Bordetella genomosp. 4]OZI47144.1 spermidine synthase [Bordetella genomosp. 4]
MPHIRPRLIFPLAIGGLALLLALSIQAEPRLLHSEPSPFGKVLVFEDNGERCLNFNSMTDLGRQTCMDLQEPDELVFSYTRMMISALFVNPAPRRILIVGLGGATLQKTLAALLPDAIIDTVEIDPAIARVAEDYFDYRPGPRQRLFVQDGRAYIENAHRTGQQYDMVMLDAFDVDYVPEHLMTVEFLEHVKGILSKDGIVVANTFTNSDLYERESATYAQVFGPFFNLRQGNRVIVATRDTLPGMDIIQSNAKAWKDKLEPLSVDVAQELDRYTQAHSPGTAKPLRDAARQ